MVETAKERRVRELADDIRLVLIPRIVALAEAAERNGDRARLARIQTSLVTRIIGEDRRDDTEPDP